MWFIVRSMFVLQIPHGFLPIHSPVIEEQVFLIKKLYVLFCCAFLPSCQNTPKSWEALPQGLLLLLMPVFSLPTGSIFWSARHFLALVSWVQRRQIPFFQVCLRQVCFSLLLSRLFHHPPRCSLCIPMLSCCLHGVSKCQQNYACHSAEFGNSQEIQSPKNRFFPSLESLHTRLLQNPSSKMHSVPRSARVQKATLPFKQMAADGSHH